MRISWALLESFVAVAEHGSLSAAARATQTSQPTLSRHIAQLEQEVGERLFDRDKTGVVLTPRGAGLMRHAKDMADAAARLSLTLDSQDTTLSGSVRVTASQVVATYVLPTILTRLRIAEPEIAIELVASDRTENLLRREADIAVRMYRPTQEDVIAKKIGELKMGMFASKDYIERNGVFEDFDAATEHNFIGYDRSTLIIDGFKQVGLNVDREFFAFRSDDQVVCWEFAKAGYGIGFNQIQIGEAAPNMVRVEGAGEVGRLPVWLTSHTELRSSPRVRRVFDFIADELALVVS